MAKTFVQEGETLTLTAPTGGVTLGVPVFIDGLFVIPQESALQTAKFEGMNCGVHAYTKTASQAWAEGQDIFWDVANAKFDCTPGIGPLVGVATQTIGSGAGETTGYVKLCCSAAPGIRNVRVRATAAEIKAGKTIVPAIAGRKIRMIDAFAVAYGGAVAAVTTVDILGTLSSSRKLVAFAQASLTQSTVLRAGATGAAVLADGASFTANDAGAAVTVGLTGADITTATGVDISFTYAIEY